MQESMYISQESSKTFLNTDYVTLVITLVIVNSLITVHLRNLIYSFTNIS